MAADSVCTGIIPENIFHLSFSLSSPLPPLPPLPPHIFLSSLHMSHSVFVIFLAQVFAFAVSIEDLFFHNTSPKHAIVEPLRWKQYLPTEMENANCNLIQCKVSLGVMVLYYTAMNKLYVGTSLHLHRAAEHCTLFCLRDWAVIWMFVVHSNGHSYTPPPPPPQTTGTNTFLS